MALENLCVPDVTPQRVHALVPRLIGHLEELLWTFRCYVSPSGRDMIEDWYRRRSDEVQTAFDVVREYLEQRPRDEWRRPDFDLLSGKLRLLGGRHFFANIGRGRRACDMWLPCNNPLKKITDTFATLSVWGSYVRLHI